MKVVIRNPRRREVELHGRKRVIDILRELDLNQETHIVIRGQELLTRDDWVAEDDSIEVVSAISGGVLCGA